MGNSNVLLIGTGAVRKIVQSHADVLNKKIRKSTTTTIGSYQCFNEIGFQYRFQEADSIICAYPWNRQHATIGDSGNQKKNLFYLPVQLKNNTQIGFCVR